METEVLLMPKVNDNYTHTEDYTAPSDSEDESKDINSLAMEENKGEFQLSSGNTSEVESDKKEPPDLTYSSENLLPKVSTILTVGYSLNPYKTDSSPKLTIA